MFYAVAVMVYTAVPFRRRSAALEAELTQSKLDTLRSQLRPHFLVNTLNAISVFIGAGASVRLRPASGLTDSRGTCVEIRIPFSAATR